MDDAEIKRRFPFVDEVWHSGDGSKIGIRIDVRRFMFDDGTDEWDFPNQQPT